MHCASIWSKMSLHENVKISKNTEMQNAQNMKNRKCWLRFAIKKWGGRFRPKNRVPWYPLELKKCRTRRLGKHKLSILAIYLTFWPFSGGVDFWHFFHHILWFYIFSILMIFCFCVLSLFLIFWFSCFCHFFTFLIFDHFLSFFLLCTYFCHFLLSN